MLHAPVGVVVAGCLGLLFTELVRHRRSDDPLGRADNLRQADLAQVKRVLNLTPGGLRRVRDENLPCFILRDVLHYSLNGGRKCVRGGGQQTEVTTNLTTAMVTSWLNLKEAGFVVRHCHSCSGQAVFQVKWSFMQY